MLVSCDSTRRWSRSCGCNQRIWCYSVAEGLCEHFVFRQLWCTRLGLMVARRARLGEASEGQMEMTESTERIVVTMPAYHAEQTIEKTYRDIPHELGADVLVVDDASKDRTVEVAQQLGLKVFVHPANRGYGGNQKTCYDEALRAGASVIVLLHPDYQYDPRTLTALVEPLLAGRADFTFGSRFANGADPRRGGMPLYRYIGNKLTTAIENAVLGTHFAELHSGLKAYTRQFLETIDYHAYSDDFVFDSQMIIDSVLAGKRIEEVSIPTRYTTESSSISVSRSLRYIWLTLIELRRFKRKYALQRKAAARNARRERDQLRRAQ